MSKKTTSQHSVKVEELMSADVLTAAPGEDVAAIQARMSEEGVSALPVVDAEGSLLGIVTSTDVLRSTPEQRVAAVMSEQVYTLPPYADVHIAARIMRNHSLHHVVIVHEKKVVGILASFDLLVVVEQHRYVAKGLPTTPRRRGGRRRKNEKALAAARQEPEQAAPTGPPPEELQRERLDHLLGHLSRRTAKVERDRARTEPLEPDFAEQAVVRENDQVLDQLSRDGRNQLELVGRALERLDEGVYATCEGCGGPIGAARLEALPYAITCIACARKREAAAV